MNHLRTLGCKIKKDFFLNWDLILMMLPVVAFFVIFCYVPMYGILMSFYDYIPALGFQGSEFVGLRYFEIFFSSPNAWMVIRNTLLLNVFSIIFVFPLPIVFAIMLFEIRSNGVVKTAQFVSELPYFISLVVVCGMIIDFVSVEGAVNDIIVLFGGDRKNLLNEQSLYMPVYIISDIWQTVGFSSIIYYAALAAVDTELFEAARIDGAGRLRQVFSITIPQIMPTIIVMFILRMGGIFNVGFEKAYLLKNYANRESSEVLSTFIYERGIAKGNYGYGTAVGLFSALVNFAFLYITNKIARKTENSLW